jgi:hypothetical protein
MLDQQIKRYESRIAEEEQLAGQARSSEGALAHLQAAMIYKSELAIIRKKACGTHVFVSSAAESCDA